MPIAIMNTMAKVFGIRVNEKLKAWIETQQVLGEEQSGFRKGRGALENIFTLKNITGRNMSQRKKGAIPSIYRSRRGVRSSE